MALRCRWRRISSAVVSTCGRPVASGGPDGGGGGAGGGGGGGGRGGASVDVPAAAVLMLADGTLPAAVGSASDPQHEVAHAEPSPAGDAARRLRSSSLARRAERAHSAASSLVFARTLIFQMGPERSPLKTKVNSLSPAQAGMAAPRAQGCRVGHGDARGECDAPARTLVWEADAVLQLVEGPRLHPARAAARLVLKRELVEHEIVVVVERGERAELAQPSRDERLGEASQSRRHLVADKGFEKWRTDH